MARLHAIWMIIREALCWHNFQRSSSYSNLAQCVKCGKIEFNSTAPVRNDLLRRVD